VELDIKTDGKWGSEDWHLSKRYRMQLLQSIFFLEFLADPSSYTACHYYEDYLWCPVVPVLGLALSFIRTFSYIYNFLCLILPPHLKTNANLHLLYRYVPKRGIRTSIYLSFSLYGHIIFQGCYPTCSWKPALSHAKTFVLSPLLYCLPISTTPY
jgi:hypothetical protein